MNHFNYRRPDGSMIPLEQSTPFFAGDLQIPDPDNRDGRLLWPPPQPNLALQYLAMMPPDPFIASEAPPRAGGQLALPMGLTLEVNRNLYGFDRNACSLSDSPACIFDFGLYIRSARTDTGEGCFGAPWPREW
jgi:hypothetical protein